ncbi:alpha/beta fold hydrolase [Actinomycetospora soli]|uniref:alpha/beta fold hydrolase n=1 Tax=Actinomycetospora soli TaxID=2893887 RepID=UPI001E36179D|nr:alpha/beta fold hydrolase [Actinomycetospora soli]MCD2189384.1 alpha/beta fold hydrolase [Actinomycetospora soli]
MTALEWSETGDGPPVVLLHGLGGDAGFWTAGAARWAAEFRVLTVDLPGSGSSPVPDGPATIEGFADAVRDVLDVAGVARTHVVGFSMGGLVAQALATGHPGRVDRLVLASTYAVMNPQARMFLDAVRDVVVAGGTLRPVFPLVCPWLFSVDFLADPANAAWLTAPEDDEPTAGWLAQYRAQQAFDGRDRLVDIAAPTLVVRGAEDRLVTAEDTAMLSRGIPDARAVTVEGAGHLVDVEAPDRFARLGLVESYTAYTGRMRPLPDWLHEGAVVAVQGGTDRARARLDALVAADVPLAALWIQDWVGERTTPAGRQLWWDWQLDTTLYPGWPALLGELAARRGARMLVYVNPFLADQPGHDQLYREALANGYLVRSASGAPVAIPNAGVRRRARRSLQPGGADLDQGHPHPAADRRPRWPVDGGSGPARRAAGVPAGGLARGGRDAGRRRRRGPPRAGPGRRLIRTRPARPPRWPLAAAPGCARRGRPGRT